MADIYAKKVRLHVAVTHTVWIFTDNGFRKWNESEFAEVTICSRIGRLHYKAHFFYLIICNL